MGLTCRDARGRRDVSPRSHHPHLLRQRGRRQDDPHRQPGDRPGPAGERTVVLDADFGLRNLDLLLGLENRIVYTAQEVLAETCRLEQALVKHKLEPNLALLPAGNPRMLEWLTPEDMQRIVAMVAERADFVLIDCPAGIEDGFKNAAAAAREAIVITTPEVSAVRDADRVIGLLNTRGVAPVQLVLNRVRPG